METHQRFLLKIDKVPSGCWEWKGALTHGYGQFYFFGKNGRAHRYSFIYHKGPIPEDKVLDHLCDNRKCVNPDHLEATTTKHNVLRGVGHTAVNARKTICKRGHPLSEENTYVRNRSGNQERTCRQCMNALRTLFKHEKRGGWGVSPAALEQARVTLSAIREDL